MDLLTGGAQIAGLASSLFGLGEKSSGTDLQVRGAKEQAAAAAEQARLEQQVEAQRFSAMQLDARRRQREAIRIQQRTSAMAIASGIAQGAEGGSGLQGGLAGIAGQTGVNLAGISQNLGIGENIFGLNAQISQQKIRSAQAGTLIAEGQGQIAKGQGFQQLGASLVSAGPTFGQVGGSLFPALGKLFG